MKKFSEVPKRLPVQPIAKRLKQAILENKFAKIIMTTALIAACSFSMKAFAQMPEIGRLFRARELDVKQYIQTVDSIYEKAKNSGLYSSDKEEAEAIELMRYHAGFLSKFETNDSAMRFVGGKIKAYLKSSQAKAFINDTLAHIESEIAGIVIMNKNGQISFKAIMEPADLKTSKLLDHLELKSEPLAVSSLMSHIENMDTSPTHVAYSHSRRCDLALDKIKLLFKSNKITKNEFTQMKYSIKEYKKLINPFLSENIVKSIKRFRKLSFREKKMFLHLLTSRSVHRDYAVYNWEIYKQIEKGNTVLGGWHAHPSSLVTGSYLIGLKAEKWLNLAIGYLSEFKFLNEISSDLNVSKLFPLEVVLKKRIGIPYVELCILSLGESQVQTIWEEAKFK